jgi:hypothetical protein
MVHFAIKISELGKKEMIHKRWGSRMWLQFDYECFINFFVDGEVSRKFVTVGCD